MICMQKIYGVYGLNHQIIEKSYEVTMADGRNFEDSAGLRIHDYDFCLLKCLLVVALSRKKPFQPTNYRLQKE